MTTNLTSRATRFVPLGDLTVEHAMWQNPRTVTGLKQRELEELSEDIKLRGITTPPEVLPVEDEDGNVVNLVIDGQRRVLASRMVFKKDQPIEVIDLVDAPVKLDWERVNSLLLNTLASVTNRANLSSYELSEVAEQLRNRGMTLEEISAAIKKSQTWCSRFLKARLSASPSLLKSWRDGKVTDEQFKDLADVEKEKQDVELKEVTEAAATGGKGEARARAKEAKANAKKEKAAKKKKPVVTGEQQDLFEAPKPKKAGPPRKEFLEELVALSTQRSPTADYVKGIFDGVKYTLGQIGPEEFASPWVKYLNRVGGSASSTFGAPKKKSKKRKASSKKSSKKKR